jgi:threonine/homoserine/homoserine lactone efflux protein
MLTDLAHSFAALLPVLGRWIGTVVVFATVTSASPGPVNIMAASNGVHHGWRRSMPHVVGASLGFALLLLALGLGPGAMLARWSILQTLLRWLGSAFLLALAWQMGRSSGTGAPQGDGTVPRRLGLRDGLMAQWLNPKAWIVAATGVSTFAQPESAYLASVCLMAGVFLVVCLPSIGIWAVLGAVLQRWLLSPVALNRFNLGMAAALAASVLSLWL